jgi:plastocyanin domain-containing protein
MDTAETVVVLAGLALIAWINWYFLFAGRRRPTAAVARGGVQEVTVVVEGGYDPASVRVSAGSPLRIHFDRRESAGCSEEVVFPDFGVRRFLPPNQRTTLDLPPREPGSYEFTCGMGMLRGRLLVEEEAR